MNVKNHTDDGVSITDALSVTFTGGTYTGNGSAFPGGTGDGTGDGIDLAHY